MSLTRDLVTLISAKTISDVDRKHAALFVLDTLACAIAGRGAAPARMLMTVAPPASSDVARRAFLVGGLAHIIEMDDLHRDSVTHPGSVVIPAAWAIAEDRNLGGRQFLDAVLAGYEACCRVGMSVGKAHYRVWHNTSTCGPFGAAIAAAKLIGLSPDETVWALGNAGTQSSGLWEFLATGAMSKHLHTARAAESGVLAALLAKEGFTGPEKILEGEKGFFAGLCSDPIPQAIAADPARPWELTRTSIKPWPCCRHTHPAIDAALELHAALQGAPVARVTVGAYRAAIDVCDRPDPQDPYSAKFSLQHTVAVALKDGLVNQASFDAEARSRMAGERTKVSVAVDPKVDAAYPKAWGVEVAVETADGRRLAASRRHAKGDPENPLSEQDLKGKARAMLLESGLAEARADAFIASILGLTSETSVRDLDLLSYIKQRETPARKLRSA